MKKWNWQQKDWPNFSYDSLALNEFEAEFASKGGFLSGSYRHINGREQKEFVVDLIKNESITTSEIEGEILNRDSLQSSIKKHFGLKNNININQKNIPPAEQGIADLMFDLHKNFSQKLSDRILFKWHKMLLNGRQDLQNIGKYRTHKEPMQVVSGAIHKPKIHFEAPPSKQIKKEMKQFINWFNESMPQGKKPLPALTRAAIVHLYFVCIHPFEDGNGRIGRALVLKSLSQNMHRSCLVSLSTIINNKKKNYYDMLETNNKNNQIDKWLIYFAKTILAANEYSQSLLDLVINKTKFYQHFKDQLNLRQKKVIDKIFAAGIEGFKGGLSAEKYIAITKTSRATTTRDLQDLVDKKIFKKTGELKHTRYWMVIKTVIHHS